MSGQQWIELNDFRPGIMQRPSLTYPLGTATEENTHRCRASKNGALIGLPRINATWSMPVPSKPTDPDDRVSEEYRVVGLGITGPHYGGPSAPTVGVDANLSEIWVCIEVWEAEKLHLSMHRYNRHQIPSSRAWEEVWRVEETFTYNAFVRPRACFFDMQWSNSAAPGTMGGVVLGWIVNGHARMFPNDTALSTTATTHLPGDKTGDPISGLSADSLVGHQGRFVIFPLNVVGFGATSVFITTEAAYWTAQNNAKTLEPELAGNHMNPIAPSAKPAGFSVKHSMAGDELILIKPQGGAARLRGDISDPTVELLPFVQSSGMSMNNGTVTNLGLLYPIDGGGVWVWSGGESSEEVSQDMNSGFWRPPSSPTTDPLNFGAWAWGHATTQCAASSDLAFFPDNWIFDLDNMGWWKLDDPTVWAAHRWVVDLRNRYAYAASTGFLTNTDPVIREYRIDRPSEEYSWQSQPIPTAVPGQEVSISHVELLATTNALFDGDDGAGTVKITVSSSEGTTQTRIFTITGNTPDRPKWIRERFSVRGTYLQVRIESEATDPEDGAPTVHAVRLQPEAPRRSRGAPVT